jgi:hypothetical protein
MISLKIDVTKITKDKLFKGEKGTYLNAVLIETPNSEYSDYMIVEDTTKEERDNDVKGTILGNAKNIERKEPELTDDDKSNLPF